MIVPLRCACGEVRGELVGGGPSTRLTCYCDDCQAYGRWIGGALDARGGTAIVQVAPSRVRVTAGGHHLRIVQLGPGGLLRMYAACCRTPIANTLPRRWSPFIGVIERAVADPAALDAAVGPSSGGVQGRFAPGGCPEGAAPRAGLGVILRALRVVLTAWWTGAWRPSPFFGADGRLALASEVLTAAARQRLG